MPKIFGIRIDLVLGSLIFSSLSFASQKYSPPTQQSCAYYMAQFFLNLQNKPGIDTLRNQRIVFEDHGNKTESVTEILVDPNNFSHDFVLHETTVSKELASPRVAFSPRNQNPNSPIQSGMSLIDSNPTVELQIDIPIPENLQVWLDSNNLHIETSLDVNEQNKLRSVFGIDKVLGELSRDRSLDTSSLTFNFNFWQVKYDNASGKQQSLRVWGHLQDIQMEKEPKRQAYAVFYGKMVEAMEKKFPYTTNSQLEVPTLNPEKKIPLPKSWEKEITLDTPAGPLKFKLIPKNPPLFIRGYESV